MQGAANALANQGQQQEEDLGLARDAAAFYLKLSESVLARTPGHLGLAESVAGGFTQYAYAFVAFEADRLDATDTRAALRQRLGQPTPQPGLQPGLGAATSSLAVAIVDQFRLCCIGVCCSQEA